MKSLERNHSSSTPNSPLMCSSAPPLLLIPHHPSAPNRFILRRLQTRARDLQAAAVAANRILRPKRAATGSYCPPPTHTLDCYPAFQRVDTLTMLTGFSLTYFSIYSRQQPFSEHDILIPHFSRRAALLALLTFSSLTPTNCPRASICHWTCGGRWSPLCSLAKISLCRL